MNVIDRIKIYYAKEREKKKKNTNLLPPDKFYLNKRK
jgi:hypothetical protein